MPRDTSRASLKADPTYTDVMHNVQCKMRDTQNEEQSALCILHCAFRIVHSALCILHCALTQSPAALRPPAT